ncbi:ATP-dependent endonuclease [Microbacterium sp. HMWF026]|uniref:ATP-dependent nuclease n=1 Tax=Microbacterium sp. HMWF026 TaxID=2056861 RepID=UPI000D34DC69|nr:AAA family ATPase [Microbacterium sp. HMWF026]PTT21716.1 ATP-dependent endonuclease [Microbacterium sp. HMWF026]
MHIARVIVSNFRGISSADVRLTGNAVLLGDNNSGKSTLLEAVELAIGADRLHRRPVIDEHDFYGGRYLDTQIQVEVVIVDLDDELQSRFRGNLEFWDESTGSVSDSAPTPDADVVPCVRVTFIGRYDPDDDDFEGRTWFSSPVDEAGTPTQEAKSVDKREFGFLLLRALRTGTRAMSMERGSLLDFVLRAFEIEVQMWENLLERLRVIPVAGDENTEFGNVLSSIDAAMKRIVAMEWADAPHLRVSELTRDDLRHVLRSFMATGAPGYAAPFNHQGSGTINSLVIAMLTLIAEKRSGRVIFAMEEPEISVPPTSQKRVVDLITGLGGQAIFTTHSPYVLEEFEPEQMMVVSREHTTGTLAGTRVDLPASLKAKIFRSGIRTRFCEALLARRVLVTEGDTEAASYAALSKTAARTNPERFARLDTRGWAIFDAQGETNVAAFSAFFRGLNKQVAAVFDQQPADRLDEIEASADLAFEQQYSGFEALVLAEVPADAQKAYVDELIAVGVWPSHIGEPEGEDDASYAKALKRLLQKGKGDRYAADLLAGLVEDDFPATMTSILEALKEASEAPAESPSEPEEEADDNAVSR